MQMSEVNKQDLRFDVGSDVKSDVGSDVGSDHLGHLGISFLTSSNHQLFRNIAYVGYFRHFVISCICVFVNLCLCICVFDSREYQF